MQLVDQGRHKPSIFDHHNTYSISDADSGYRVMFIDFFRMLVGLPPEKWSSVRYGF